MISKNYMLASAAPIILAFGLAASAAQAQQASSAAAPTPADAGSLDEIVVTAQKRSESIQKVPLSIQAVSGADLQAAGVTDPTRIERVAPSVKVSNAGLLTASLAIRIRGFGTPANSSSDSDVAAYVDGVFIPRPGAIMNSFLDVRSVEVLNGPQGTLFGRNAAMGALSINSNAPTREQSLSATIEGGSYGTFIGTLVGNAPVSDNAAVRVALRYDHTDGMYKNNLDGKTYGSRTNYVGRASFLVDVTPDLTWTVRVDGSHSGGDAVSPQAVYVGTSTPAQLAGLTAFLAAHGATPPVYSARPSFHFNQSFAGNDLDDRQYGISSNLSWSVSPELTVRLIDSYRDWKNFQGIGDTVGTSLDLLTVDTGFRSKAQSHELQLISPRDAFLDGKLGFTAGLYYFHENYDFDTFFNLRPQFCPIIISAFGPDAAAACASQPQRSAGLLNFDQTATSYAVYGQVNYNLLENVSIDLGARQTWDEKEGSFLSAPTNPVAMLPIAVSEGSYPFKLKDNRPSFRASLSWNITPQVMAFGTFGTGYKSGGFSASGSGFAPLPPSQRVFKAETVKDIEIGMKSTFLDRRAQVNLSFFSTRLDNFQDRSFDGTNFVTRNSGDVRSKGIDFDSRFRPVPELTLRLGATYLDAKYISNNNAPGLEGCNGTPTCPAIQDLSGKRLQFSPKLQANAGVDLAINDIFGGGNALISLDEHHTSSYLTSNTNNPSSRLPGYWTTDLTIGVTTADERWRLELFSTNLFNKHYYTATLPQVLGGLVGTTDPATGAALFRGILGDPRRIGARISVRL